MVERCKELRFSRSRLGVLQLLEPVEDHDKLRDADSPLIPEHQETLAVGSDIIISENAQPSNLK